MSEKINWSKLSELKPYAPTGPGKYVMRCGGVVEVEFVGSVWRASNYAALLWSVSGSFCHQENHPCDIVAPAPDVLPLEECERLKDEINHWKVKAECYGDMVHGCHPVFVRLGVLDENKRGSGAIANAAQKLSAINIQLEAERDEARKECERLKAENEKLSDLKKVNSMLATANEMFFRSEAKHLEKIKQLEAERDECKQAAERRQVEIERPTVSVDVVQAMMKDQIADLQERVAKLEMQRTGRCGVDYQPQVVTMPQATEPLPAVTDAVEPVFKVGDVVVDGSGLYAGGKKDVFKIAEIDDAGDTWSTPRMDYRNGTCRNRGALRHATPAERAAFFAANPTLHPAYKPEHGDMAGWRYLEEGEVAQYLDELFINNCWHHTLYRGHVNESPKYRRRVQAEKEVAQ